MALFGDGNDEQIQALQAEVERLREANKKGSAELASARQQAVDLKAELTQSQALIEAARAAVLKARKRQKNSVERANRFKAKTEKLAQGQASTEQ